LLAIISASSLPWHNSPLWAEPSDSLLIKCDAPIGCALSLDGKVIGQLGPGKMKSFSVPVGQHLLGVRSSDRRFASKESVYDITISGIGGVQTEEEVVPFISFKAAVEAAQKGTVIIRTNKEADVFSIEAKQLRWNALTNHEEWNKSGFVRTWTQDYVAVKQGVEIEVIGAALTAGVLGEYCVVRGQFLGVEFLVGFYDLAFVDQMNHVDLTDLIMCHE
jgi:hypothetical protein